MKMIRPKRNPHVGSSFESWLATEGIRQGVDKRSAQRALAIQRSRGQKNKLTRRQVDVT